MKYAIIGDIHGNIEALSMVVADARSKKVDGFLCVGDIVGYGANPSECIKLIRDMNCVCVAGNHDFAVCGKTDVSAFNEYARQAVQWTMNVMSDDDINFLSQLPYRISFDSFSLVHGSFYNPEDWGYVFSQKDAYLNFKFQESPIGFIGHSHVPGIYFKYNGVIRYSEPIPVHYEKGIQLLINIGSVGQPRDNDPRSSYVIIDEDSLSIEYRRITYDIAAAQKKILSAGLPEMLSSRLEWGR